LSHLFWEGLNNIQEKKGYSFLYAFFCIRIAPRGAELEIHEMFNLHTSMDTFVGRQKKSN
jgi:hypothetical protein